MERAGVVKLKKSGPTPMYGATCSIILTLLLLVDLEVPIPPCGIILARSYTETLDQGTQVCGVPPEVELELMNIASRSAGWRKLPPRKVSGTTLGMTFIVTVEQVRYLTLMSLGEGASARLKTSI